MSIEQVWHTVARRSKDELLGLSAAYVRAEHWSDAYPQPGYVGKDYRPGSILFIAQNPAGGGDEYDTVHSAIKAFAADREMYTRLNAVLGADMANWKIFRTAISWVLQISGLPFSQTAYLNLFKWRTTKGVSGKEWNALYQKSWPDTASQVAALEPGLIVLLGKGVGYEFDKRYQGSTPRVVIERMIGDTKLVPQLPSAETTLRLFGERWSASPTI